MKMKNGVKRKKIMRCVTESRVEWEKERREEKKENCRGRGKFFFSSLAWEKLEGHYCRILIVESHQAAT